MKNYHRALLTILLFLLVGNLAAQRSIDGILKGKVSDQSTRQPLFFATISIFNAADSSLVTGGTTDEQGVFSIEIKSGVYYADITFISYQNKIINDIRINEGKRTFDLGEITLSPDATVLAEVEVRAEKSRMQMSLDKRVFNVGQDLANSGGNAAEVLDNVPSVAVDVEGNVSLRGSGNVRILVNGKPSGLVGISNTDGLRQLPADLIDRIEVITNPSARYEAEGMAGIINIILKKETEQGLNGSFDLNAGYPDRYGASINLNYRRKKLNLFTNYGLRYNNSPGGGFTFQDFTDENGTRFLSEQRSNRTRGGWSNSIRGGLDYYFNDNTVLTSSLMYRYSNDNNLSTIEYRDYESSLNNLTGISVRTDDEAETEPNLEYAMTFRRDFEKEGHELVIDFRYQDDQETEKSSIREEYFTPEFVSSGAPNLFQRSGNAETQRNMIAQVDYVHPFAEEGKFEIGYRGGFQFVNNDYLVEELKNNIWEALPGVSNELNYDEIVHAAYAIWGNKYGKFSFQGGLRAELSDIRTELLQTNEVNQRDYFNLFPSVHFGFELPKENSIQLSYSRRLSRPDFWDLNPFFSFSDARNFRSGNPNLNPEFTDAIEIGHLKYWNNGTLSSSIYYRHTEGIIENIQTIDENGNTVSRPQNLATEDAFGTEFTFSYTPFKWWDVDGSFNFYRAFTDGGNLAPNLQADFYSWFTRLNSKLKIGKTIDGQLRVNYRGPRNTTQGKDKAEYYMDIALSKDILKGNGTLTLSGRDVFNTRRRRFVTEGVNFYREGDFQWRARQVLLTFNYRLNQIKKRDDGDDRGGEDFD